MANSPQARKRARQNVTRRARNASHRSMFRTFLKRVESAIESGNQVEAKDALTQAIPVIDRMAVKGIIHKNKAARHKSRLTARVKAVNAA